MRHPDTLPTDHLFPSTGAESPYPCDSWWIADCQRDGFTEYVIREHLPRMNRNPKFSGLTAPDMAPSFAYGAMDKKVRERARSQVDQA